MGRNLLIASASVLAFLVPPASMASAHRNSPLRRCAPQRSTVISADLHAQVYAYGSGVYACLMIGRRTTYLGQREEPSTGAKCTHAPREGCGAVSEETLAGDVVAYTEKPLGYEERVIARSVATGETLHDVALSVATRQSTMLEFAVARHIVVNAEGWIAWIQEDSFGRHDGATPPPTVYDIFTVDSRGFDSLGWAPHGTEVSRARHGGSVVATGRCAAVRTTPLRGAHLSLLAIPRRRAGCGRSREGHRRHVRLRAQRSSRESRRSLSTRPSVWQVGQ